MSTAPAPGAGVPADQAFVNNLITQSTTAGPWIDINTNYLLTSAYLVFFIALWICHGEPLRTNCLPPFLCISRVKLPCS